MNGDQVFDDYCELDYAGQREFKQRLKEHEAFNKNLCYLMQVGEEHGMEAATALAKGDVKAAQAAAKSFTPNG